MKKKNNFNKLHLLWIIPLILLGIALELDLFSRPIKQEIQEPQEIIEVELTPELLEEICYEIDTYFDYCYPGKSVDVCASIIVEKLKRIYGVNTNQLLEINEFCYK